MTRIWTTADLNAALRRPISGKLAAFKLVTESGADERVLVFIHMARTRQCPDDTLKHYALFFDDSPQSRLVPVNVFGDALSGDAAALQRIHPHIAKVCQAMNAGRFFFTGVE